MNKTLHTPNLNPEAFFRISYGLYIVSTKSNSRMNGYISNTVFQITAEPAQFAICCSRNNLSSEMIRESGLFSISVLERDADQGLISLFGYQSGRDIDKFANTDYITTDSGIPVVTKDSLAWFECSVKESIDVGTHILFTGEILNNGIIKGGGEPMTYSWYRENRKGKSPKNAPTYIPAARHSDPETESAKYRCLVCGHIYDPAEGDPESGIPSGTGFDKVPDHWRCKVCGADKASFEKIV